MSKQTIAFYNHFSFLYPVIDAILKPQKILLFEEVNKLPKGKLLDVGVGNGRHLSQYKKHKVVGIDTSIAMLNIARKNRFEHIELIEMSGEALSFEDQLFDYVVLSHVIAVVDDANQLLQEVSRVLKPQGQLFILNHFTPDNWLQHIDSSFELIAKALHFKSVFRLGDLSAIKSFKLKKEVSIGMACYFKLFIYQKR
jgi:phosphatidylethanolamine/phosphatidyl-N-methylethanolamine N-methyltransferase